jgi:hypothetical protein
MEIHGIATILKSLKVSCLHYFFPSCLFLFFFFFLRTLFILFFLLFCVHSAFFYFFFSYCESLLFFTFQLSTFNPFLTSFLPSLPSSFSSFLSYNLLIDAEGGTRYIPLPFSLFFSLTPPSSLYL